MTKIWQVFFRFFSMHKIELATNISTYNMINWSLSFVMDIRFYLEDIYNIFYTAVIYFNRHMMRETKDLVRLFPTSYKKEKSFLSKCNIFSESFVQKKFAFWICCRPASIFFKWSVQKKKELYIFTNTQNIRYMSLTYFLSVLDNLFGFVFIFENYFSGVALNSTSGFFKTRLFFDALILSTSQCTKNGKKVQ